MAHGWKFWLFRTEASISIKPTERSASCFTSPLALLYLLPLPLPLVLQFPVNSYFLHPQDSFWAYSITAALLVIGIGRLPGWTPENPVFLCLPKGHKWGLLVASEYVQFPSPPTLLWVSPFLLVPKSTPLTQFYFFLPLHLGHFTWQEKRHKDFSWKQFLFFCPEATIPKCLSATCFKEEMRMGRKKYTDQYP